MNDYDTNLLLTHSILGLQNPEDRVTNAFFLRQASFLSNIPPEEWLAQRPLPKCMLSAALPFQKKSFFILPTVRYLSSLKIERFA